MGRISAWHFFQIGGHIICELQKNSLQGHIFPNAHVATTKMHTTFDTILAQFIMFFHRVGFILFGVLALKTLNWKFLIGCWRIQNNDEVVTWANSPDKMVRTMWKSMTWKYVPEFVCIFIGGQLCLCKYVGRNQVVMMTYCLIPGLGLSWRKLSEKFLYKVLHYCIFFRWRTVDAMSFF